MQQRASWLTSSAYMTIAKNLLLGRCAISLHVNEIDGAVIIGTVVVQQSQVNSIINTGTNTSNTTWA